MSWLRKVLGGGADHPVGGSERMLRGFETITTVVLPSIIAEHTQAGLRTAGLNGNEGLAVWTGIQDGTTFLVRTVVSPRQRGIQSADGVGVVVDGEELHRLNVETFKRGERLFAQVHSHPGRAYHSEMDDRYAVVTSPGGLSLVVPDFAVRPFAVADCAVYRLAPGGRWRKVRPRAAAELIRLQEGAA